VFLRTPSGWRSCATTRRQTRRPGHGPLRPLH
jgi:hypothetical protein